MPGLGCAVDGNCQHPWEGGCPLAALCGLLVHPRQTSNPTLDLADGKKIEQSLLPFSRNGPRDPRLGSTLGLFPF